MQRNRKLYIAKAAAILSVVPMLIYAYKNGPDPRLTNGPGDAGTCTRSGCHTGTALNGGGGTLLITAEPPSWTPGTPVTITIKISDATARVYGFQASARPASEPAHTQAGSFVAGLNQFVQCEDGHNVPSSGCPATAPVQFIEHSQPLPAANGSGTFTFTWNPPSSASVGDVTLYVAANAANGNDQPTGDHIYTGTLTLKPASANGGSKPAIYNGGLADNWTYTNGVAPETWMVLFGQNFAPAGAAIKTWDGDPAFSQNPPKLPSGLSGTSVTVNGKTAPIYYVLPGQLAFLAPQGIGTGSVQVIVTTSAGASDPITITATDVLPAFYSAQADPAGRFPTTAVVPNSNPPVYLGKASVDRKSARPVKPGEVISLFGTGFGATNPAIASDAVGFAPAPLVTQAVIRFGDTVAEQVTSGYLISPGLYQFNVKVPDTLPNGDITLTAQVGSVTSSSKLYISVQK